jgi:type I restriction-modification system DNA methylase subunit
MSAILVGDGVEVRARGFLRLHEPACGAGGMVIAYADALRAAGLNYQTSMHAICIDVDARCVHMTYL